MRNRAFTLIELLVVVAVLSLLMSILLPALASAKDSARRGVCLTNIRHLVAANSVYAADNRGHYVHASEDIFVGNGGRRRWHGVRESPGVSSDPAKNRFDPAKGPLARYLGSDGGIKQCPGFQGFSDDGSLNAFEASTGGYGYNQQYIGGRNDLYGFSKAAAANTARDSDVKRAADTVMFTDTAFIQAGGVLIEYSFCEPPYWQLATGAPSSIQPSPSIHFRHAGTCSAAWADGHADSRKMSFSGPHMGYGYINAEQVRALALGWFGPDSNDLFDLN